MKTTKNWRKNMPQIHRWEDNIVTKAIRLPNSSTDSMQSLSKPQLASLQKLTS